jgi:hypothetical protein
VNRGNRKESVRGT